MKNNHDNLIRKIFWKDNKASRLYRRFNQTSYRYPNILTYLKTRFSDSESIYESVLRICLYVFERPTCQICGSHVNFIGKPNSRGLFRKTCSYRCSTKLTNNFNCHIEESQKKVRETKLKKYGDANYNNREKAKQTCLEKYGCESTFESDIIKEKGKKTKLERYGDENYNNREQYEKTCLIKYGKPSYVNANKGVQTKYKKYGLNHFIENSKEIIKRKKEEIDNYSEYISNKVKLTKLKKYGDEKYNNIEKCQQTCLEKYGSITWSSSNEGKKKLHKILSSQEVRNKVNSTKRKNNSFHISKSEEQSYELIKEKYNDVLRQYKSDKYPFLCDFYIPSLDLYIECNYHWTHGGHPYDPKNKDDINKLNYWKEKYNNKYGKIWAIRDPLKRKIAKENNLNYLEFFNIQYLKDWLNTK